MDLDSIGPLLRERYEGARGIVRGLGSAAVAFSGGVDSALALKLCRDELGERAVAVTARSASFAPEELEDAVRIAREIGARQVFVETEEITRKGYAENPASRCFHCKTELYAKLRELSAREGLAAVVDGVNADDAEGEDRPGLAAGERAGVVSPLREAGLGKADVRALARALGLSVWEKPAMACLSSRIPFGEAITEEKLAAVAAAESALRKLGFAGARVRHHGQVARIELAADRLDEALAPEMRRAIVAGVRAAGFPYVTLDLEGYRSGSMHEVLSIRPALGALLAAVLALGAVGCMETTVKPATRRIITQEEALEAESRRKEREAKDGQPARPTLPRAATPEAEIERLRGEVEKDPKNPKWHFLLGRVYENQGKLELAELRYRRGADLILPKDHYTGPHYVLGRVLARQGKFDGALAELKRAVAIKPPDIEGYYLNPDYRESYFLIGAIHYRSRNVGDSERAFQLFLKYGGERERVIDFFPEMIAE